MKFTLKIFGIGMLTLAAAVPPAFGDEEAERVKENQPKVVDLNEIDLEQVEDNWDSVSPVAPVNPNSGIKIKDIVEPTNEYTYASFGKPDPFAYPFLQRRPGAADAGADGSLPPGMGGIPGVSSNEIAISSPLQSYPIEVLTVKGVYQLSDGEMRAMVLTPKNQGIVVKSGDPMSSGKVLRIERDALIVRLYRIRKDGVREYDDKRIQFGIANPADKGSIKLAPGKVAQFPGMETPADQAAQVGAAFANGAAQPGVGAVPGAAGVGGKAPIVGIPGGVGAAGYVPPEKAAAAANAAAAAAAAASVLAQPPAGVYPVPVNNTEPESGRPGATPN